MNINEQVGLLAETVDQEDLDGLIVDVMSDTASNLNNAGKVAQINYLIGLGMTIKDIKKLIAAEKVETADEHAEITGVASENDHEIVVSLKRAGGITTITTEHEDAQVTLTYPLSMSGKALAYLVESFPDCVARAIRAATAQLENERRQTKP